jgi:hypothetical protein
VTSRLAALAVCSLVILTPRPAAAEWHFTPMAGVTFFPSTNLVDLELATDKVRRNLGGAVTLLGGGVLGVESVFVWTPGFFDDDDAPIQLVRNSRSLAWMGNVVLTAPRRWTEYSLRPFVSGGVGWLHVSATERTGPLLPVDHDVLGFNIGGGAVGFFTRRTGVRFDVRYYSNLNPTDEGPAFFGNVHLRYVTASVGFIFRRGFKPE